MRGGLGDRVEYVGTMRGTKAGARVSVLMHEAAAVNR